MRIWLFAALAMLASAHSAPAFAEVMASSPSAFTIRGEQVIAASPERAWGEVTQISRWWDSAHTYSGDARRLSLTARAGGCFCERWNGQSVEHARVILAMESEGVRTLRMYGALGPLQAMGAHGVLTITVAPQGVGAKISFEYRVDGDASLELDSLAAPVNSVLMMQLERLSRFAATGVAD